MSNILGFLEKLHLLPFRNTYLNWTTHGETDDVLQFQSFKIWVKELTRK